jgi:hypothetical protein
MLGVIPGAGAFVAPMVGAALELAADFAEAGADVVVELERIRTSHELLADVRSDWNNRIADRFPNQDPVDATDTPTPEDSTP